MATRWLNFVLLLACLVNLSESVDRSKFRTCQDTGFCRKYRHITAPTDVDGSFQIQKSTLTISPGKISGQIQDPEKSAPLDLEISFLKTGSVRVKVSEMTPRWQPTDLLLPPSADLSTFKPITAYDQLPTAWRTKDAAGFSAYAFTTTDHKGESRTGHVLVLQYRPFRVEVFYEDVLSIVLNDRNLMHFQQQHSAGGSGGETSGAELSETDRHGGKEVVDYGEDGLALYADGSREEKRAFESTVASTGENFGGHFDSMPRGPLSVGLDISFPAAHHVYGIPEHTTPLSLPTTITGSAGAEAHYAQPYRLYNLDVFEYELQETMALYGHIPFMYAHGKPNPLDPDSYLTSGVFWFNPTESFVDISDGRSGGQGQVFKESHWLFESGLIDVFLFPGPGPKEVIAQYTALTGSQALPPAFALGYHQCRWNYRDERDVQTVHSAFETLDFPFDVLWLDIEHTEGKRYFTWDKQLFPDPVGMQRNLSATGRKMVTIVDPHIKRDTSYGVHSSATEKGYYVKAKDGAADYEGWCWPGSSSYLDFTSSVVRAWWASLFTLSAYQGSTLGLYTWNDMNEPSVFNGPEVSMPKDALNLGNIEHREWHNLYGLYMAAATAAGQTVRASEALRTDPAQYNTLSPGQALQVAGGNSFPLRPFVLTRAFWAGSQRFGAMWTGDNTASWGHLQVSLPMVLSLNIAGFVFSGADTGGFFGNPDPELFTRWFQAGAFSPFFRGHAHHDTVRREPYLFAAPYASANRAAAVLRYTLLPVWYTAFFQAYTTGVPVLRPVFFEFPGLQAGFATEEVFLVGDSLLVRPVTAPGVSSVEVFLPPVHDSPVCLEARTGVSAAPHSDQGVLPYYALADYAAVSATSATAYRFTLPVTLTSIPVFVRPGAIVARKMRTRRSAATMFFDPFTLVVAPGVCGGARGGVYLDDELSTGYLEGRFVYRFVTLTDKVLTVRSGGEVFLAPGTTTPLRASGVYRPENKVERVVLLGQPLPPTKVVLTMDTGISAGNGNGVGNTRELFFVFDSKVRTVTVKKPDVSIALDWTLTLLY